MRIYRGDRKWYAGPVELGNALKWRAFDSWQGYAPGETADR
jgi:hypothetical protein